jgi:hypothetical protein
MLPTHGLGSAGNNIVINRVGLTIFYLKTWVCPDQTFFDTATDLCVGALSTIALPVFRNMFVLSVILPTVTL